MRLVVALILCFHLSAASGWEPTDSQRAALSRISAQSMKGHLSFLASDSLEGRGTPSRGLDIAAEYIAAQFRRAGLDPIGPNDSYFQVAEFVESRQKTDGFRMTWKSEDLSLSFSAADVRLNIAGALDLNDAPLVHLPADNVEGKVVLADGQVYRRAELQELRARKPALVIVISKRERTNGPDTELAPAGDKAETGLIYVFGEKHYSAMERHNAATISVHASAPARLPVQLRNVGAILRGSDPQLRDQFVVLSAHYDHLGMKPEGTPGDRIFNGANDNGSGTVSVVEVASALATMPVHPKRSLLFLTFFGEEGGLLGSNYYVSHPVVPLAKTIANLNLEQVGRTDEHDGIEISAFAFTGPSFSNIPGLMEEAAKKEGVSVYKKRDADAFFARSDNYAFARAGVIDHTLVGAFEYPDYHAVGDEWPKIDYNNMAKVDRAIGAGLLRLADEAEPPKWNTVPATEQYRKAAKK